ncbi:hypothetical protein DFJ58DRAFT_734695 [Suillus subalutaceus]|uniref:uncharacterized protein n=1 Tax=Suillus subalutaceus TaxID=48586 RepID=UPI001B8824D2|nr:uncharacterized protein DFJ58DRAFT_734695 [Suillus subalutaceus]KAG1836810.1 hypothetical protein DFJ58DRAFT_734695 [Suillus subalutaceus]
MSSHSTSASSTAAANQALIALVARLTEMVEDIIWLPSQEEKNGVEPEDCLRSVAITLSHRLGHNQDMCMKHPLYSKTLGDVPPIAPAAPATAPVPTPAPAPTPAPPPAPARAPAPVPHVSIRMPRHAASGEPAPAGLLKTRKHRLSTSPPLPRANRSQKPVIKLKEILSDTDTDTEKVKGKGKGKAKAKAPEVDGDEDDDFIDVDDLPDVEPRKSMRKAVIPAKKPGTLKASRLVVSEGNEEVDELEEDEEAQGRSKASHCTTRESIQSKGKGTGRKAKVQEQPPTDGSLPPCDRCRAKKVECCPRLTKKGDVASTCSLWSATIAPTTNTAPPVAAVTTHSKTTRSKATGKKMGQKSNAKGKSFASDKTIRQPSPIQEEDESVQMLDGTVDVTGAQQQSAPLASANDFPPDHWIEPDNDELPPPPPSPAMASEDDIWFSPLPVVYSPPSPTTPSRPSQSTQHPLSHDQMEAMLAQIHLEMEELHTCDQLEIDFRQLRLECRMDLTEASDSAMSVQIDHIEQDMHAQRALLSECTAEVRGIVRYLREQRCGQANSIKSTSIQSTPPSQLPAHPSVRLPALPGGDTFGDTADGSPVARHNWVSSTPTNIPPLTMRESGSSVPPVGSPPVQSPDLPVARPSSVPADVQSISAPLPRPRYGPLSHQGRSRTTGLAISFTTGPSVSYISSPSGPFNTTGSSVSSISPPSGSSV